MNHLLNKISYAKFKTLLKNDALKIIVGFSSSQMVANIIRIISGLLTTKFVDPLTLGTFNSVGLVNGYLPIAQLGIMNGLNRDLPYYFGKGERNKALEIASVAKFWMLTLGTLSFLGMNVFSLINLIKGDYGLALCWFSYASAAFFIFFGNNYLRILFRTGTDFINLSRANINRSIAGMFLVIPVYFLKFIGLGIRNIFIAFTEFIFLWIYKPFDIKAKFNYKIFKELLTTGFPIHLVGQVSSLWEVLQGTLILILGGKEALGLFAIAIMVNASMSIIPQSVSQVLYPRLAFEFGKGKNVKAMVKITIKPLLVINAVFIPFIIILWFSLPMLINVFLPKYHSGIEAAQWILILNLVTSWGAINNIFNVVKKQKDYFYSIISGITVYTLIVFISLKIFGFSLVIFPVSMVIGRLVVLMINIISIKRYIVLENNN